MKKLPNVTLIGVDCKNLERLKMVADICCKDIEFGAVKLLSSIEDSDPRVVPIKRIKSTEQYSSFMIKEFPDYVDTDFALTIQHDGFILNAEAWTDDFLKYDYIGAPWYHMGDLHVGNGGFSLRSRRLSLWLKDNFDKIKAKIHPEDVFICRFARPYIERQGMVFAPENVATHFSREGSERSVIWDGEFGFHGGWTDISRWLDKNPQFKDKILIKYDDYRVLLAEKYPVYDGSFFTFRFKKYQMKDYKSLSVGKKNYEARVTIEKYHNWSEIKPGNSIIFKREGVSLKKCPIKAFDKKVVRVEHFSSLSELKGKYPYIDVTFPSAGEPNWKRFLAQFLKTFLLKRNVPYSIFWF